MLSDDEDAILIAATLNKIGSNTQRLNSLEAAIRFQKKVMVVTVFLVTAILLLNKC